MTWGPAADAGYAGDSCAVQHQLKDVQQIQGCAGSFAAILGDGSVVTWVRAGACLNHSGIQDQLKHAHQIQASNAAFAAILGDGCIVTWGDDSYGGDSSAVKDQLQSAWKKFSFSVFELGVVFSPCLQHHNTRSGLDSTWAPSAGRVRNPESSSPKLNLLPFANAKPGFYKRQSYYQRLLCKVEGPSVEAF